MTTDNPKILKELNVAPKEFYTLAPVIAKGLNAHIGKAKQICAKKMAEGLRLFNEKFKKVTPIKVQTMIKYMRHRGTVPCIMSLGKGYWIADSPEDCIDTLQMLDDRVHAEEFTLQCLIEQVEERFKVKVVRISPEDSEPDDDYRTIFIET